jgi:hypothetical protein
MLELRSSLTSILGTSRVDDFRAWLRTARPGERVVYHQGFLVVDRGPNSLLEERRRRRLDVLATATGAAAAAGHVHLVQWRRAVGTFVYLAVKTHALPDRGLRRSEPPDQPTPAERTAHREARSRHFASPVRM